MHEPERVWEVDLIKKYLKDTATPGANTGQWYDTMDPGKKLDDRKYVYDLLTKEPDHTDPADDSKVATSMIPWNQNNKQIKKKFPGKLACGSVVKLTFWKYMGWTGKEPTARSVYYKGWNAIDWIVKSLKAGRPIRAYMKKKDHYVGIVGFRKDTVGGVDKYEFLIIDPWVGGAATATNTLTYAGTKTAFLGVAKQAGRKIEYDGFEITALEGPHPY